MQQKLYAPSFLAGVGHHCGRRYPGGLCSARAAPGAAPAESGRVQRPQPPKRQRWKPGRA